MQKGTPHPAPSLVPADETLGSLPKAELHMHLDGSLRPGTMLELAEQRGVAMPASDPEALGAHMVVDQAASLEEYLERFAITLSVMQDAEAVRRIARECVLDHAEEGVRYVEVRFCPLLNTEGGLSSDQVLDAALEGIRAGEAQAASFGRPILANIIVCALRSHPSAQTLEMAELAVAYRDRGVCGFDLAGPEAGHPVADHVEAFDLAARSGLPITVHAGEGDGAESIRQALVLGHAMRIGHGTRLFEDPALMEEVRRRGVPLEVCLTSNTQTRVVSSHAAHPLLGYVRSGIPVTLGTDNRLMSGVSLTDEYRHALDDVRLTRDEILRVARAGFEHAFLDEPTRTELLTGFDASVERLL
jgi:adenosine deaminase